jgi:hypothetical protein
MNVMPTDKELIRYLVSAPQHGLVDWYLMAVPSDGNGLQSAAVDGIQVAGHGVPSILTTAGRWVSAANIQDHL